MSGPGRSCPLAYRYRPEDLVGPVAFECTTLYVVGGLYGNTCALMAVLERAASEPTPPEIVFNGDFHYLDAHLPAFDATAHSVLAHRASLGNVEYVLATDDTALGCGCNYPEYVPDSVVADSNGVIQQLRAIAAGRPAYLAQLAGLPRYLTASLGGRRVGIVHGDPESLAGWKLALEALDPPHLEARARTGWSGTPTSTDRVLKWCDRAQVEVMCCTHTGLPYAQDYPHAHGRYLVANNGCAGLPNFTDRRHGLLTRLSTHPDPPADGLYGLDLDGLWFDALPVAYDHKRWSTEFLRTWPPGSPAHHGYYPRIRRSTWLTLDQAARGDVRCRRPD